MAIARTTQTINGVCKYESEYSKVDSIADLPQPDKNGVITLLDNATYLFIGVVDLLGKRLVCGENTTLLGGSSENCRIKSTGLTGEALITSNYSLPIRNITIEAEIALDLEGDGVTTALDWFGVNFTDCATVGTIKDYSNFIMTDSSFLNSGGLTWAGTIGTVGIFQCFFDCNATNKVFILHENLVITRRFRVIYSAFIVLSGETGIDVDAGATIPVEGYILDTVNFAGGGTYIDGILYSDNRSKWINCVGIINSVTLGNMYMKNNEVATDIIVQNNRYKMAGVTQVNSLNQRFNHDLDNNSLQYISTNSRVCSITVGLTFLAPTNNVIGFYIGINRGGAIDPDADRISESEVYVTANGSRPDNAFFQTLTTINLNDKVYIIVQNKSGTGDVTVEFCNLLIQVSSQN
jgi:hypothetical protein